METQPIAEPIDKGTPKYQYIGSFDAFTIESILTLGGFTVQHEVFAPTSDSDLPITMPYSEASFGVRLFELVGSLSRAMDLVCPAVVDHHRRVGYLAMRLADHLGLTTREKTDIALAGLIHDAGAFSLSCRLDALAFDSSEDSHCESGYRLFRMFPRFAIVAQYVRYHHAKWNSAIFSPHNPERAPIAANLLFLADRIDVLMPRGKGCCPNISYIRSQIYTARNNFNPRFVEAFFDLSTDADFKESLLSSEHFNCSKTECGLDNPLLCLEEILDFSPLFSQIIDFRSRFTATHSRGVAETAVALAELFSFDQEKRLCMSIAGDLHDLGKLAVPAEIIMKPGKLTQDEFSLIQSHPEQGQKILADIPHFEDIATWAGQHHERLNGKGYPKNQEHHEISIESRILAVADVFTAITEDRPYRVGMDRTKALAVLDDMAVKNELDGDVAGLIKTNYDAFIAVRQHAQDSARQAFMQVQPTSGVL
ncbi:HD-GYP domain-containing protein [Desulfovibrio inopinatus]|uniref:HD-GYP domain-containing protein n=1 Tax=Desulfovibrio inopinatus TaxID=102109 RepID=UPI00146F9D42|nr:HD domain-containing phosphohydrolase [Desulfovibrio inopinatus]